MRIAVDAMGGDHAPDEIVAGALEALPRLDKEDSLLLVGPQELLETKLAAAK
jgi:glycerol-3-phosphate acyltransferase PlsX